MPVKFLHFELTTNAISIGERIKGGIFRPCIETIPSSTLRGALRTIPGFSETVFGIGFFRDETYHKEILTYAPFDRTLSTAKLPLSVEYLSPASSRTSIAADIYIISQQEIALTQNSISIYLGAFKSKGFGRCSLKFIKKITSEEKKGYFKGRIFESEAKQFGINHILKPIYGFLFEPSANRLDGSYKRALYENSIIKGPSILIGEDYKYDE